MTSSRATRLPALRTRRRLAAAGAAVVLAGLVAAGALGTGRYVITFWLYRGFPAPSVPRTVAVGRSGHRRHVRVIRPRLQTITLRTAALGGYPDRVYVLLPPGYAARGRRRYPVLYLLHGFPGQPQGFLDIGGVARDEATLVAAGRMKPIIVVMPTGTRSYLTDEEWANGVGKGNDWETFVAVDLVRAIDHRYRTVAGGPGRGLGGLSEGGYGALNIGLHHPGEFGLLESWSGYVRADRLPGVFGRGSGVLAYNSPARWAPVAAPELQADGTYVWFYIGASDPLAAQNRAFSAELGQLGVRHRFFEVRGRHDWRLWRGEMPQALMTAAEHLAGG